MRRLREFTLREALEVLAQNGWADCDCGAALNARGSREIATGLRTRALASVVDADDPALDSRWGLRRLRRDARHAIAPAIRAVIANQLAGFAALLDAGHCVYFAPEGSISADGHFGRVRSGTRELLRLAGNAPPVLPIALAYDALAPGALRVVVRVGAPLQGLDASSARPFDAALRRSIRALTVVNPSHLIALHLTGSTRRFTTADLAASMRDGVQAIERIGLMPDRLLTSGSLEALAERRLRWLERHGVVARDAGQWRNDWRRDSAPGWRSPHGAVHYLVNTLEDLAPGIVRAPDR